MLFALHGAAGSQPVALGHAHPNQLRAPCHQGAEHFLLHRGQLHQQLALLGAAVQRVGKLRQRLRVGAVGLGSRQAQRLGEVVRLPGIDHHDRVAGQAQPGGGVLLQSAGGLHQNDGNRLFLRDQAGHQRGNARLGVGKLLHFGLAANGQIQAGFRHVNANENLFGRSTHDSIPSLQIRGPKNGHQATVRACKQAGQVIHANSFPTSYELKGSTGCG